MEPLRDRRLPIGSRHALEINRAPVLTLWAAVSVEHLAIPRGQAAMSAPMSRHGSPSCANCNRREKCNIDCR
jgi:hypothetical protein